MKFFSILKANAEVSRLETELAAAVEKLTAFSASEPENLAALQNELASNKQNLDKALNDLKAANDLCAGIAAKDAEIVALKAAAVELEKSVEARASEKALAITQAQGQTKPVTAPKAEGGKIISRDEFNKMDAKAQSDFCRAGGRIN